MCSKTLDYCPDLLYNKYSSINRKGGLDMKYEICKVTNDNDVNIYSVVAWTDNRVYAQECAEALELLKGKKYAVCVDGKPM